jgi:drug/metabolite transporter (DMT)-like permease
MATAQADLHADASPLAGIAFMCAGVFCLTVNDVFAKWMGMYYPVPEVAFLRMLFALPMIVAAGFIFGGTGALATRRLPAQLGRGLLATLATLTFYLSLTLLPLAEATAIAFTAPLFVTMLAIPLLGERPGRTQWAVTCIGFIGVLLIVRPGSAAFTLAALAPLGTALAYALLMLTARMLGRGETIWATMFYATLVPLVITAAMVPWFWETPSLKHLPHFVALGFSGGLALTLITQGFRIGVASVVAPFDYTGLVRATLFGWFLWAEIPSPLSILGGAIIGACGVYLAYSQSRRGRRRAPEPLHPPRGD